MRENGNLEIVENNSSSSSLTTTMTTMTASPSPAPATQSISSTAAVAAATEYTDVKKDDLTLNSYHITQNCHNSPFLHDNEFYLIKHNIPSKPKINQIQWRINNEKIKLQTLFNELKIQDEEGIKKLVISIKENNIQYSSLISSELNVIRKTSRAVWTTKIVLDNLYNQICSVSSFKDLVETITPSLTVMKSIRSLLIPYIRESEHEFKNISDLLCDVLFNASQIGGYLINFKIANNTALNIINDALFKAENKIKTEFLPIPNIIIT
jgi:hypothetical protein